MGEAETFSIALPEDLAAAVHEAVDSGGAQPPASWRFCAASTVPAISPPSGSDPSRRAGGPPAHPERSSFVYFASIYARSTALIRVR